MATFFSLNGKRGTVLCKGGGFGIGDLRSGSGLAMHVVSVHRIYLKIVFHILHEIGHHVIHSLTESGLSELTRVVRPMYGPCDIPDGKCKGDAKE